MTKLVTGLSFDIGQREIYEDRVAVRHLRTRRNLELTVALVADGVGGAHRGERAAQLALDVALHYMENGSTAQDVPRLLSEAFVAANQAILDEHDATSGVFTTLTAAAVHDNRLYVANTGDSRAYLCRAGSLTQLTIDHSFANVVPWTGAMSIEAAALNPRAGVLMHYLGQRAQPHVDHGIYGDPASAGRLSPTSDPRVAHKRGIKGLPLRPGDSILVCSDGLVKPSPAGPAYVTPDEITRVLGSQEGDKAARSLVSFALGRNADDNVSVGLIQLPRQGRGGRIFAALLLLLLAAGLAALFLWQTAAGRRALSALVVQTPSAPEASAAAVAVTDAVETAAVTAGSAATPLATRTPDAAATAAQATTAAVALVQSATSAAATSSAVATATRAAFCSLADNFRYEVRDVALEPDQIHYTVGNRFPSPIRVVIRWQIDNVGPCPLVVRALHRQPDGDDAPLLAVTFERDGIDLGRTLPPGEIAELTVELDTIETVDELRAWRDLYQSQIVRWRLAVAPADGSGDLRPVGQKSLPLNRVGSQPWIIIRAATPTPTATAIATATPTPSATPTATATPVEEAGAPVATVAPYP